MTTLILPDIADHSDPIAAAAWHLYLAEMHLEAVKKAFTDVDMDSMLKMVIYCQTNAANPDIIFSQMQKIKEAANGYYKRN